MLRCLLSGFELCTVISKQRNNLTNPLFEEFILHVRVNTCLDYSTSKCISGVSELNDPNSCMFMIKSMKLSIAAHLELNSLKYLNTYM